MRSSYHPVFELIGIASLFATPCVSRLPDREVDKPSKKTFKSYPVGFFHLDIAEVRTEEGKLYLFVTTDRTSKFAYVELHDKAIGQAALVFLFLGSLIEVVPYKIHTVLTDNGVQLCYLSKNRLGPTVRGHPPLRQSLQRQQC
jgi:hypothetical protein